MKAFKINPATKDISAIDMESDRASLVSLIGQSDVGFDEIDDNGDRLYFDEACFIREQPGAGRFQLDNLPPVAGIGIVAGHNTAQDLMADVCVALEALRHRVKFL
jgi:hypothetical protein